MAADRMAYDTLQTTMARQRVTVYDLYGLLDVSPNATEANIREAYEALIKKLQPKLPSNVVNVAYSILTNPHKRAQYDRDRLEYLYTHFSTHESFPPPPSSTRGGNDDDPIRDEQIQVYATTLTTRVHDPLDDKKTAIATRLARTRDELDEFNEKSSKHRQDWATSPNTILRMAGNALREIVVCAEEDLCMLEDELGRLNGILAPRDTDGPAGRVTSGQYGSDVDGGGSLLQAQDKMRYGVLAAANHRPPSIPRSPTVPIKPLSASKLGVQGEDSSGKEGDSSSSEGVGERLAEFMADDRVGKFLLGPAVSRSHAAFARRPPHHHHHHQHANNRYRGPLTMYVRDLSHAGMANTNNSPSPSTLEKAFPPRPIGMGLVEWQALHGALSESNGENQSGRQISAEAADFKMPQVRPSLLDATDDHPLAPFTRKAKVAARPATSSIDKNGSHVAAATTATTTITTGNQFGFHVAQPSERAPLPTGNVPARSAGIKDFQVRVWSAAKAAKSSGKPQEPEGVKSHAGVDDGAAGSGSGSAPDAGATDQASFFRRTTKSGAVTPTSGGEASQDQGLDDPFR